MLVGCGGIDNDPSSLIPNLASAQSPLTTTDTDVAPECAGILTFLNTASFTTLDVYLPSNVATNLINRRNISPFTAIAQVASVSGVGEARLEQIEAAARTLSYIGSSCVGIMDEMTVSTSDSAAITALVNSISDSELHDVLPYAWNGAVALLNGRPYASAQAISDVAGIGPVSLRNIRNSATLSGPFETLVAAVNTAPTGGSWGAYMARHFDWWDAMHGNFYNFGGMECFGLEENSVPNMATVRPYLANAAEVRAKVMGTVANANYAGAIPAGVITAGMANFDALTTGRQFKGCYLEYAPDPWSGHSMAFFVDTENGFSVLAETYWSE